MAQALTMDVPYKLEMMVLVTLVMKLGVSLYPYSGKGKSPMFGDYEAQRHWMEVTVNLPMKDWYQNTTDNDLLYWGLDYPPLTAYHSYFVGKVAEKVNPDYVALGESRGYESHDHQYLMRMSVLVSDTIIFTSGLYIYIRNLGLPERYKWVAFALCSHPGLTMIDYGHFQYNCVSLGLALWFFVLAGQGMNILSAVAFSLALNFKQMELYHALPVFFHLLWVSFQRRTFHEKLKMLVSIAVATSGTFIAIWSPFLSSTSSALAVLTRVFPVNRGIFEDYVANFWCVINVPLKLKRRLESGTLALLCLALTVAVSLPTSVHLLLRRTKHISHVLVCSVNVSLAFFLFSYHVHEKSILLPCLSVSLLSPFDPWPCFWFLFVSHFSMLPLYIKDDIVLPAMSLAALYLIMAYNSLPPRSRSTSRLVLLLWRLSLGSCLIVTTITLTCPQPKAYPYLWTLIVSVCSFGHFVVFLAYFLYVQFWCCPLRLQF